MKNQRTIVVFSLCVIIISLGALLGCELLDRNPASSPVEPEWAAPELGQGVHQTADTRAAYQLSDVPGITLTIDVSTYHKKDQPFGKWVVWAEWRRAPREAIVSEVTFFTIDELTGTASALLPPSFLDAVFQECHDRYMATKDKPFAQQDLSVWWQRPGLYLNIAPTQDSYKYYNFGEGMVPQGWNFGGALYELVDQLTKAEAAAGTKAAATTPVTGWHPGAAPLKNVGALLALGNPLELLAPAPGTGSSGCVSTCASPITRTVTVGTRSPGLGLAEFSSPITDAEICACTQIEYQWTGAATAGNASFQLFKSTYYLDGANDMIALGAGTSSPVSSANSDMWTGNRPYNYVRIGTGAEWNVGDLTITFSAP